MVRVDLSWEEKRKLWGNYGHTRDIETIDFELDGLENFLSRLSDENKSIEMNSLLLWKFLLRHLKEDSLYRFYKGRYKWFYYSERSNTFDATWIKQLRSRAWLPRKGDAVLHLPSETRMAELPDEFDRKERLASLLGMKKDIVARLAEEAGVPAEDIEYLRRYREEFEKWKEGIRASEQKPAFPKRTVKNRERRQEKLSEQLDGAPEKEYEQRERSVRTTRGEIDPRTWLRSQYTNDSEQMICQICKDEMPFRGRDGKHYFEAVEVLSRSHFTREMEGQFLALCPICAARYEEFVKRDEGAMKALKSAFLSSGDLEIPVILGELETTVEFVETHFQDIKTILGRRSEIAP